MNNKDDPAFPVSVAVGASDDIVTSIGIGVNENTGGLTKREYFAAMAMQGFVANSKNYCQFNPTDDAHYCIKLADALLEELSK